MTYISVQVTSGYRINVGVKIHPSRGVEIWFQEEAVGTTPAKLFSYLLTDEERDHLIHVLDKSEDIRVAAQMQLEESRG